MKIIKLGLLDLHFPAQIEDIILLQFPSCLPRVCLNERELLQKTSPLMLDCCHFLSLQTTCAFGNSDPNTRFGRILDCYFYVESKNSEEELGRKSSMTSLRLCHN